jgi:hypothetical protein
LAEIKILAISVIGKAKVRKGMLTVLASFLALQLYFVRELLAAELLFGLSFIVLLVLGSLAYLVGSAGVRGLKLAEAAVRVISDSARRGFSNLEINRKAFRLEEKIGSCDK